MGRAVCFLIVVWIDRLKNHPTTPHIRTRARLSAAVLEPTAEMKAVMEKLVAFVQKNGPSFEAKVSE